MANATDGPGDYPDRDGERALHARLLAGDPLAPAELAETYLTRLVAWLGRREPRADPQLVESTVIDSVLGLARAPERYDPGRATLVAYLRMDARGDLRNALERERRQAARRVPLEEVELGPRARNLHQQRANDPAELVLRAAESARLAKFRDGLNAREQEVVQLMADGERRTPVFAAVIGLDHLGPDQQAREVKRWKDRLVKRLRRRAEREPSDD